MLYMDAFLTTLPVMAKGMGGIFIVTVVIILCIALLNGVAGSFATKSAGKKAEKR